METATVRVKLLRDGARVPTRATELASGFDLSACITGPVAIGNRPVLVPTGIALEIPPGVDAQVRPRSGLARNGVLCTFGTIDADYRGELLVTRRTDDGLWHPPGGYADLGETTTHTVVREVREETGLEIEPMRVVGLYSEVPLMTGRYPNGDVTHNVGIAFECRITGGALHADGDEASAVAFKPVEELLAQPFHPFTDTPQLLRDYLQRETWPVLR